MLQSLSRLLSTANFTMADSTRTVIYLSPDGPIVKEISERYRPTGAQSLLRVEYSGINPADIKHAILGLHSSVAGYDMSGEVIEVGPDSSFKLGDKIFGVNLPGPNRPLYMGAHQDYALAASNFWYKVPSSGKLDLLEAATLPVMTLTAADGLFNLLGLAFPAAGVTGLASQALLIWGGASTVGTAAVQLAKAAGHSPIFATASTKNHATLKSLGADYCFDYRDDDVVDQIREAIRASGQPVCRALDAVGAGSFAVGADFEKSSPGMTAASISPEGKQEDRDVRLACVLPVGEDPRYKLCFATRDPDSPL
ncbi:hypothetical protein VTI74DRAFT_2393 [Chaetomium olivicolor]